MFGLGSTGGRWFLGIVIGGAFAFWANYANAQISPDDTLPNNSSVTLEGNTFNITGGTQVGSNLFHSFQELSVLTSSGAFFNNAADIQNIFSRVTGGEISNIDGLIRANGNANLFLLNPNGIVFGQNARLNIGGSFIASTASSLKFADDTQFSAERRNQTAPLLTISVPVGLQFNKSSPGEITVNGSNLAVPTRQTLALVGGDINVSGGRISAGGSPTVLVQGIPVATTPGGRIELGSVLQGEVSLTPSNRGFSLGYTNVPNFGNIQVRGEADVDVSGTGGGEIQINARNLLLSEQARVCSTTQASLEGGNITVNATESVELIGSGDFTQTLRLLTTPGGNALNTRITGLYNVAVGAGNGGDLTINTGRLIARNNTGVIAGTQGQGNSGNLTINASQTVELTSSILTTGVGAGAIGNGGNLTINTNRLLLQDNSQATATTLSTGKGGDLTVNADSVELIRSQRVAINPFVSTGTSLSTASIGDGDAGNLTVNTRTLVMRDGAGIFTGTYGKGQGGNLTLNAREYVELTGSQTDFLPELGNIRINTSISTNSIATSQAGDLRVTTPRLVLQDGAQMTASAFGAGRGGTVKIDAGLVEVRGNSPDGGITQSTISAVNGGIFGRGTGGNIRISADKLIVRDGGRVNAESRGNGDAGNIEINAREILLDQGGRLTAATVGGERGNISLNSDAIIMGRGSNITANATGNNAIGGNITIDTSVLAALENSDISANSTDERGGNITINTQGLFGTEFRSQQTPLSDITATGKTSELQGTVQINIQDVDPTRGLTELPSALTDPSNRIVTGCPSNEEANFVISGRGGLPEDPRQVLRGQVIVQDFRTSTLDFRGDGEKSRVTNPQPLIVEAQGWIVNEQGNIELVVNLPNSTAKSTWDRLSDCIFTQLCC